jgi:hypothetical protein
MGGGLYHLPSTTPPRASGTSSSVCQLKGDLFTLSYDCLRTVSNTENDEQGEGNDGPTMQYSITQPWALPESDLFANYRSVRNSR